MELIDVVRKLVGPVSPVGDFYIDRDRLENLKEMTKLIDVLVYEVDRIATENKDRAENSLKLAGEHCSNFLDDLGIKD